MRRMQREFRSQLSRKRFSNNLLRAAVQVDAGGGGGECPRLNIVVKVAVAGSHALRQVVHGLFARCVAKGHAARPFGETFAVAHGVVAVGSTGAANHVFVRCTHPAAAKRP